ILSGLGFREDDHERTVATFSGGWQMRVALAKLLLKEPDVLLLDEPTNHLDLPTLDWLEQYLTEFRGALVIVSHDRAFLDRMVTSIVEIDRGHLRKYVGSYSNFEHGREERREKLREHAERLASERKRIERFIERFRYKNTKARQVQSRVRLLKKLDEVEVETEARQIHFRFPPAPHSGRVVLEVNNLSKSYDGKKVLRDIDLVLERGQKVALVGVNGAGKSTFCRMITGTEPPDSGEAKLGYKVDLDYFAQEADFHLTGGQSVLDELAESATVSQIPDLRKMLGAFLFRGEDVFKLVDVLSGGEKSRLALVKMLLRPSNFIILDEPTNHLDISSKDVLLSALKTFNGTLLIVSHDRYFLDRLVDRVLELEGGRLKDWPGNFGEYLERKALFQEKKKEEIAAIPQKSAVKTSGRKSKEQRRVEAEKRNRYSQERQQVQTEMAKLTQTIEQMEARKSELEVQLGDEETYKGEQARDIVQEYERIRAKLPELYEKWEQLEEQREAIEKAIHS
ncbi:ABC-F family ATP-binding cassette domain-containing protein, partial [bacterium]|nr:ABC-F family ATP-binding cassette domain-containing protein [bacterium]